MVPNQDGLGCVRGIKENMQELFEDIPVKPFKPVIYYDETLDCIRAIMADCSLTEVRLEDSPLVLLERNYVEDGQARYVCFHIEGARGICKKHGLKSKGVVNVSGILLFLSMIVKNPRIKGAIKEVALPILADHNIDEIEFPSNQ